MPDTNKPKKIAAEEAKNGPSVTIKHNADLEEAEANKRRLAIEEDKKKKRLAIMEAAKAKNRLAIQEDNPNNKRLAADSDAEEVLKRGDFGLLPLIGASQNLAGSYSGDQIHPSPIMRILRAFGLATETNYKDREDFSTLKQFSFKSPAEFAAYRVDAIEIFQKFNEKIGPRHVGPLSPEQLKEYLIIYKEAYPGVYQAGYLEDLIQKITEVGAPLTQLQARILTAIQNTVQTHLNYASMYPRELSVTSDQQNMKFYYGLGENKKEILSISNAPQAKGNSKLTYNIADGLNNKETQMALMHMAEEISQRRIFFVGGVRLDPNMHKGQLLYLTKELICSKYMKIQNINEVLEALKATLGKDKEFLQIIKDLEALQFLRDAHITKKQLVKAFGAEGVAHQENLAASIMQRINNKIARRELLFINPAQVAQAKTPQSQETPTNPQTPNPNEPTKGPANKEEDENKENTQGRNKNSSPNGSL